MEADFLLKGKRRLKLRRKGWSLGICTKKGRGRIFEIQMDRIVIIALTKSRV